MEVTREQYPLSLQSLFSFLKRTTNKLNLKMTEIEIEKSFLTCTPGVDEPFEFVMGDNYMGNQIISALDAKKMADFIYESLGLQKQQ